MTIGVLHNTRVQRADGTCWCTTTSANVISHRGTRLFVSCYVSRDRRARTQRIAALYSSATSAAVPSSAPTATISRRALALVGAFGIHLQPVVPHSSASSATVTTSAIATTTTLAPTPAVTAKRVEMAKPAPTIAKSVADATAAAAADTISSSTHATTSEMATSTIPTSLVLPTTASPPAPIAPVHTPTTSVDDDSALLRWAASVGLSAHIDSLRAHVRNLSVCAHTRHTHLLYIGC
jgi:hypothetical protein